MFSEGKVMQITLFTYDKLHPHQAVAQKLLFKVQNWYLQPQTGKALTACLFCSIMSLTQYWLENEYQTKEDNNNILK